MTELMRNRVLVGDVRSRLRDIESESVDCVITSPPYYALRSYQAKEQIGLEATVDGWVVALRDVMREIARVLKPSGVVWVNVGDSYSYNLRSGAPPKSLLLGPERLALALLADGWIIRSKVVWAKTNPMPAGVRDRLTSSWEIVYLLVRSQRYFFDLDAIRVPHRTGARKAHPGRGGYPPASSLPPGRTGSHSGLDRLAERGLPGHPLGKNPGDVWCLGTASFRGAHFATFPATLVKRPLLATCPERVCASCGRPWQRNSIRDLGGLATRGVLRSKCDCTREWEPGLVLDPFLGSGTVALAAQKHGRDWLGIELNAEYAELAMERITSASEFWGNSRRAA